jgi:hypothetical protein
MRRRFAIISALVVLFLAWSLVGLVVITSAGTGVCALVQPVGPHATPWSEASLTSEQWEQITHERCDRPLTGQFIFVGAGYVALVVFAARSLRSPA